MNRVAILSPELRLVDATDETNYIFSNPSSWSLVVTCARELSRIAPLLDAQGRKPRTIALPRLDFASACREIL